MSDSAKRYFEVGPDQPIVSTPFRLLDEVNGCPPAKLAAILETMAERKPGDTVFACGGQRVISGTGLDAVPTADELVRSVFGNEAALRAVKGGGDKAAASDRCCGCGGCDKQTE